MKNSTRIVCSLLLLLSNQVCAQVRFGLEVAVSSSMKASSGAVLTNYDAIAGWQVGVLAEIPLSTVISLQPALLYSTVGNTTHEPLIQVYPTQSQYVPSITYTTRVSYLQLPILILFKAPISHNINIVTGIGPYGAMALQVKVDDQFELNGLAQQRSNAEPITVDNNPYYGRFDYGLSGKVGVELFDRLQVGLGYDYGLANISGKSMAVHTFNRNLNFSLVFCF